MMEAARTSETSVDIQLRTRQYIPEDSELHTRRREISHRSGLVLRSLDVCRPTRLDRNKSWNSEAPKVDNTDEETANKERF
jgi:hypothetical protein